MASSPIVLSGDKQRDIHALGRHIEEHIANTWQTLLQTNHEKLLDAYNRAGDMAYGTFLDLLFRPIHRQIKQAGLRLEPKLPGDFDISREWGTQEETDQQRWMWSTVTTAGGEALGTIVTITHHDHTRFHVPRRPEIIALTATGKEVVVEALSQRSTDFAQAREFTVEYAEYLRSQEAQS